MPELDDQILSKLKAPTKEQFEAVYEFSKKLNSIVNQEALISEALDLVIKALNAERGLFVRYEKTDASFSIIAARNIKQESITNLSEFSSGILKQVIEKRKPILYHDAQQEPNVSQFESIRIKGILSIIGVPVFHEKELWGIIVADSKKQREKFTEQNIILLDLFSNLLSLALDRIYQFEKLENENLHLQNRLEDVISLPDIIGDSKVMRDLAKLIQRVARTDATVLITGESGTGKDLIAKAIHQLSPRKDHVYLAQFCGSIPDNLLESELFGYKKGAFTGANTDKKGLLEVADKGTFFLDEIADISIALQAKLLRTLENQEIMRLGDTSVRKIDVRIITATNKNLKELVKEGSFREDLFYRLNVFPIKVPPLRDRQGDIPKLAKFFIDKFADENVRIESSAVKKLESYNWPGNVRQLINVIQRALISRGNNVLTSENILFDDQPEMDAFAGTLADIELAVLKKRLEQLDGNKTLAAKSLGVSRKWVYLKLNENENK